MHTQKANPEAERQTSAAPVFGDDAPEWATRMLKVPEVGAITGEDNSTIYRKAGSIYPSLHQYGTSSRMRGWELWALLRGG